MTELKLTRKSLSDPWGFRIHGGRDFQAPICVLKVTGGSISSNSGLSPGSLILKINGIETSNLTHKEAEELIKNSQAEVVLLVAKGITTWKPEVTVLGGQVQGQGQGQEVYTQTSLAKNQQGQGQGQRGQINNMAKPFQAFQAGKPGGPQLINKQFNTPIKMYSEQSIAETLSAQAEVLAGGAIGVNFKKNEKKYNYEDSEVYKMLQEVEKNGHEEQMPSPGIVRVAAPSQHHIGGHGGGGDFGQQGQSQGQQGQGQGQQFGGQKYEPQPVTIPPVNLRPVASQQPTVTAPVSAPVTQQGGQSAPSQNANICADCERLIVGVFVRIKEKNLHVDCFKCSTCGQSLKNVGYYNINNKLYCDIHAKTVARQQAPPGMEPYTVAPNSPGFNQQAAGQAAAAQSFAPAPAAMSPVVGPPKPFSYTGGSVGSPSVDSYASKVAPIPFHHSPSSGGISHVTAPKSPVSYQPSTAVAAPVFQPLPQMQPLQPLSAPSYQPLLAQGTGFSSQSQQSFVESSYKKSSFEQTTMTKSSQGQSQGQGSPVVWPPIGFSDMQQGQGQAQAQVQQSQAQQAQAQQSQQQKFKQQQVPYKPLATLLQPAAAPPKPVQQFQPAFKPTQQFSPGQSQQPINFQPLVQTPQPAQQTYSPVIQPSFKPAFTPKPAAPGPKFGPGGGGMGGGAGGNLKSSQSTTLANRISRGILTQPSARQAVCGACHKQIRGPFITAGLKFYCPDHFKCANQTCKRELLEIGFVEEKGNLYCEYCWESSIAPLCNKCNKRIKYESLNAIGQHFHKECFKCTQCQKIFGTEAFFLEDGAPYCDRDWNELFTTKCHGCGFPIEAGDRWVEAMNNNYHSQCFNCSACKKNLEGQSFFAKAGRPFCKSHAR